MSDPRVPEGPGHAPVPGQPPATGGPPNGQPPASPPPGGWVPPPGPAQTGWGPPQYPGQPGWGPAPGHGYGRPIVAPDIAGTEQAGRRARLAIWIGLVLYVVQLATSLVILPTVRDMFQQMIDDIEAGRTTTTVATNTEPAYVAANLVSNVAGIGFIVVGIIFLIWVHKALTNAGALGLRLTHSPGWGVAGFIVPIIQFWVPYQAMRDLFPEGNAARSTVTRWFASWLGASLLSVIMTVTAIFSLAAGAALGLVVAGLYVVAAVSIRSIIEEASRTHAELATRQGWPAGPTAPWSYGSPTAAWGAPGAAGPAAPIAPRPLGGGQPAPPGWAPTPLKDPWNRN